MSKKEKWKTFGKNTGQAFKNFGSAMAQTARIAFGEDKVDEEGNSKLKKVWTKTGKGFGEAGKSLGQAAAGTFESEEKPKEPENNPDVDKDGAIDV